MKKMIIALANVCAIGLSFFGYRTLKENARNNIPGVAHGNGRLEATEVDVATKLAGRIDSIMVNDGDMVKKGQVVALMQTNVLSAELEQAKAKYQQSITAAASAKAKI